MGNILQKKRQVNARMKHILVMPFLQMPSGHHQVANGIIDSLHDNKDKYVCEKIDILSYSYGNVEVLISKIYIKWINNFPNLYSWLYKNSAYKDDIDKKRFHLYEWLFLYWMERLIKEKNPKLIICTHSLPSYLLSHLKKNGKISIPIVNVYTDYFINQIWGIEFIDYHFVPNKEIKEVLIDRGVKSDQILVTGIPIHPLFTAKVPVKERRDVFSVLISGGNLGTGLMKTFVEKLRPSGEINYTVLCGENTKLFNQIKQLNHPFIQAVPYISSKEEMNALYDRVDAIITKPGGVTISECLFKKIPIFIYHELPGQEEINLRNLKNWGLVYHLKSWQETANFENKLLTVLKCDIHHRQLNQQLDDYHQNLSKESISFIINKLLA